MLLCKEVFKKNDNGEKEGRWDFASPSTCLVMQDRADEMASMLAAATESSEWLQLENATLQDRIASLEGDLEAARGISSLHLLGNPMWPPT